ncbi:MAG: glutamine--tRNA ligase/YqeY domain fusion protein, partial [Gemmatimonadetes bacterium]|nr:glutamine--tRNA ligase/YqeY domain fusion protein [Gemmatimonadota bacterium]
MSGDSRDGVNRGASRDTRTEGKDFIRTIVAKHNEEGTYGGRVETRFPPEPNGYLHIGHARPIVLNFGLAQENDGVCHLRFDDTNPLTEDMKYVRAIQEDIRWLGYDWGEHLYFASDYFHKLYEFALILIQKGKAYVDSLSEEEIREYRGTVTEPGRDSPHRERSIEDNLDLFFRMKEGEFADGEHVLRAKIDMAHNNMIMRDPVLYRIRHASHYRKGDEWCIYPLYDFTHCLSDAVEDITHSLCSMEFENNREIYDWLLDEVGFEEPRTHQYEFGRTNLEYTIVSKRKLMRLVDEGHVDGWDDPRMPTLAGMRKRGIPPEAIVRFTESVGLAKVNNRVDLAKLEFTIRDELNTTVPRVMGVLRPLKVVITNYPEGGGEMLEAPSFPHDVPLEGSRMVPFGRQLFIEADDFMEEPSPGFFRLVPGGEVRLRYAYFIRCEEVVKDPSTGDVVELRCTYDPETKGGNAPDGRKVKGTIHWVSAPDALRVEARLYDRLFTEPDPESDSDTDFTAHLNPDSKVVVEEALIEPSVATDPPGTRYQLERLGYFMTDLEDSRPGSLVFNRIVTLRDTWTKRVETETTMARPEAHSPSSISIGASEGPVLGVGEEAGVEGGWRDTADGAEDGLPGVDTGRAARDRIREENPSLAGHFARLQEKLEIPERQADLLTGSADVAGFFELTAETSEHPRAVANWIVNELMREMKGRSLSELPITPGHMASLVALREEGVISQPVAKEIFAEMVSKGADPRALVKERGLERIDDIGDLKPLVLNVLVANSEKAQEYRDGKT